MLEWWKMPKVCWVYFYTIILYAVKLILYIYIYTLICKKCIGDIKYRIYNGNHYQFWQNVRIDQKLRLLSWYIRIMNIYIILICKGRVLTHICMYIINVNIFMCLDDHRYHWAVGSSSVLPTFLTHILVTVTTLTCTRSIILSLYWIFTL